MTMPNVELICAVCGTHFAPAPRTAGDGFLCWVCFRLHNSVKQSVADLKAKFPDPADDPR